MKKNSLSILLICFGLTLSCAAGLNSEEKNRLINFNLEGEKLYNSEKYHDALFYFNIVLDNDSKNMRALRNKAVTLMHLRYYKESINTGIEALKKTENPNDSAPILFDIGSAYQKLNNDDKAILFYFFSNKVKHSTAASEKINELKKNTPFMPFLVNIYWHEAVQKGKDIYDEVVMNQEYLKNIPDYIRAVLGFYGYFYDTGRWDGGYRKDRTNLKCPLTWTLNLGYQCSEKQIVFLKNWFYYDDRIYRGLSREAWCNTTPNTSTIQSPINTITLYDFKGFVLVLFSYSAINMREDRMTKVDIIDVFQREEDTISLISSTVTSVKHEKFWDDTPK